MGHDMVAKGGSGTIDGASVSGGDTFQGRNDYAGKYAPGGSLYAQYGAQARPAGLFSFLTGGSRGPGNLPGGYISMRDYFDGGGPGRSGDTFEGGFMAGLLNAVGVQPVGARGRNAMSDSKGANPDGSPYGSRLNSYAVPAGMGPAAAGAYSMPAAMQPTAQPAAARTMTNAQSMPLTAPEVAALRAAGFTNAVTGMTPTPEMFDAIAGLPLQDWTLNPGRAPWTPSWATPAATAQAPLTRGLLGPAAPVQSATQYSTELPADIQAQLDALDATLEAARAARQRAMAPYQTPYVSPGYQLPVSP